jgi:hypothetical protein
VLRCRGMGGGREGVADAGHGHHACQSRGRRHGAQPELVAVPGGDCSLAGPAELSTIRPCVCGHVRPLGQLRSGRRSFRVPSAGVCSRHHSQHDRRTSADPLSAPRAGSDRRPPDGPQKSDACARDQQVRSAAVRVLPVSDPGTPNITSPSHYLGWLVGCQKARVSPGILWGCTSMVARALMPASRRGPGHRDGGRGGGSSRRSTHLGRGFAQAVDKAVDGAVETSYARGINNGCPVDEKRILKMSPKGLVLRAVMAVEISHH